MNTEERLAALEKMVNAILANPPTAKVIGVNAIHFEDENGVSRGMIGVTEKGMVGINLSDEKGNPRVVLNYGLGSSGLVITDENHKVRVHLVLNEHGPGLLINNEDGKPSIMIMDSKAGPLFRRFDKNGGDIPIY